MCTNRLPVRVESLLSKHPDPTKPTTSNENMHWNETFLILVCSPSEKRKFLKTRTYAIFGKARVANGKILL